MASAGTISREVASARASGRWRPGLSHGALVRRNRSRCGVFRAAGCEASLPGYGRQEARLTGRNTYTLIWQIDILTLMNYMFRVHFPLSFFTGLPGDEFRRHWSGRRCRRLQHAHHRWSGQELGHTAGAGFVLRDSRSGFRRLALPAMDQRPAQGWHHCTQPWPREAPGVPGPFLF